MGLSWEGDRIVLAVVEGEVGFAEDAFRVDGDAIACHEEMRRFFCIIIICFCAPFFMVWDLF